ncbi:MAG: hypothetical protein ACI9WU_003885 [Myxococcota bacterium]|jgi:hypothetical protein
MVGPMKTVRPMTITFDGDAGFSDGWIKEDESTLIDIVEHWHLDHQSPFGENLKLHSALHMVAERNLADEGLPEAKRALERMLADGLTPHEARHGLMGGMARAMHAIQNGELDGNDADGNDADGVLAAEFTRIATEGLLPDFDWRAKLFGDDDPDWDPESNEPPPDPWDTADEDEIHEWSDTLGALFQMSPEGREAEADGWALAVVDSMLSWALLPSDADAEDALENLLSAPMNMHCTPDDAPAIIAEYRAFLRFAARKFDWPQGLESATALGGDLVLAQFKDAIAETPDMGELESMLEASGIDVTDPVQARALMERLQGAAPPTELAPVVPIRQQPKVGRNEPCLCGSGKKYKKCCL